MDKSEAASQNTALPYVEDFISYDISFASFHSINLRVNCVKLDTRSLPVWS